MITVGMNYHVIAGKQKDFEDKFAGVADGSFYVDKGHKETWAGEQCEKMVVNEVIADIPNFFVMLALLAEHMPVPYVLQMAFLDPLRNKQPA